MKKILILLLLSISFLLSSYNYSYSDCTYDIDQKWWEVWQALDNCLAWSALVNWKNVAIDWKWGFWTMIKNWVNNISIYLWVFAVWSIVYWALLMTLSAWEDEKVTKAKWVIKWWILWFIWLISISAIINLIVKLMYSL